MRIDASASSAGSLASRRMTALERLRRWEEHGAMWRLVELSDDRAVLELQTCHGEPVERLESREPELIAYARSNADAASSASDTQR